MPCAEVLVQHVDLQRESGREEERELSSQEDSRYTVGREFFVIMKHGFIGDGEIVRVCA